MMAGLRRFGASHPDLSLSNSFSILGSTSKSIIRLIRVDFPSDRPICLCIYSVGVRYIGKDQTFHIYFLLQVPFNRYPYLIYMEGGMNMTVICLIFLKGYLVFLSHAKPRYIIV